MRPPVTSQLDCVVLCSGGIDSSVMLAQLVCEGYNCLALHVDYGQRTFEAERLALEAVLLKMDPATLRITLSLGELGQFGSGTLVDSQASSSEFPHRNGLLVSLATIVAASVGAGQVALGVIDSRNGEYADCRDPYLNALSAQLKVDSPETALRTPLSEMSKTQVVALAQKLQVPLNLTFSCNSNPKMHCLTCSSCLERLLALGD